MTSYLRLRILEDVMSDPKDPEETVEAREALLDEELEETFPASDPPSALLREPVEPPKPA